MNQGSEKHDEFVRRMGTEMMTWREFADQCEPGATVTLRSWHYDPLRERGGFVQMDEKTVAKWRSFAASMIDQCEMRLREEVLKNG